MLLTAAENILKKPDTVKYKSLFVKFGDSSKDFDSKTYSLEPT